MEKIEQNLKTLKILSCCGKKTKDKLIKKADKKLITAISECVLNTLNGNIKVSNKDKKKLAKYKYTLRKLLSNKAVKHKKEILIQKGGFLQFLLPSAIEFLTLLLSK